MRKTDNSIWLWLKDERVSIIGTILCPMLSVVIPLVSPLLEIHLGNKGVITVLYFSQFAFLIVSLYFIMSNRTVILRQLKDKEQMLIRYFQKECHIRNEEESPLAEHFTVVSDTVQQFYKCWIAIWVLWILYYGVESMDRMLPETSSFTSILLHYAFKCVIDFTTSILLFILYLVLNNVTVYRQKREEANPNGDGRTMQGIFSRIHLRDDAFAAEPCLIFDSVPYEDIGFPFQPSPRTAKGELLPLSRD